MMMHHHQKIKFIIRHCASLYKEVCGIFINCAYNLHKKAHEKKDSMKKVVKSKPRSGCDGRIMAKFLLTTIQVNLVLIPSEAWRRQQQICLNCC